MGRRIGASAVVPMDREETWELLEGDQMRRAVELSDAIVAIEDYRMRPNGTLRPRRQDGVRQDEVHRRLLGLRAPAQD